MARLACANVPALPLQWLVGQHPDWRDGPVVVVRDERAQSPILWVNEQARRYGIQRGMRHAAALSLSCELRAGTVSASETAAQVKFLIQRLQRHSPHVEPSREEPGVFWIEVEGLGRLHPDLHAWARGIQTDLGAVGFTASVVVGHDRFTSYALARTRRDVAVFVDAVSERQTTLQVSLERLGVTPKTLAGLHLLGIHTVQELLGLPPVGLLQRFGPELYRLHRLASGALREGMQPQPEELPIEEAITLEYPESDATRLLFLMKAHIPSLLAALRERQQALKALHLLFTLEGQSPQRTTIKPATPSRDINLISDLLRLRLERMPLEAGVNGVDLLAEGERREVSQLSLFPSRHKRDLEAGNRALARIRAEFGEQAVVRAVPRNAHLPEQRFAWEPLERIKLAEPREKQAHSLVRRMFEQPVLLTDTNRVADPKGLCWALHSGPIIRAHGPYPISGGWWGNPEHREYAFLETEGGTIFWVYRDRARGQWFLQGRVE